MAGPFRYMYPVRMKQFWGIVDMWPKIVDKFNKFVDI
jgi:hypothetical protein